MRKPRPDSVLLNLPEEAQAQIVEWLLSGMPYHAAKPAIEERFGVRTSSGALSRFWNAAVAPALLARRHRAVSTADEVADDAAKVPGRFDQATIDALKQKAFELSIQPNVNPKDVKAIFALVLKARDQDLESRRIVILEKQAAQAEAAEKAVRDPSLSPEERDARMREIFGIS